MIAPFRCPDCRQMTRPCPSCNAPICACRETRRRNEKGNSLLTWWRHWHVKRFTTQGAA